MTDLLAAILSDPGRAAEIPDQEVRGLLVKVAGLLTALSARMPASASGPDQVQGDRLLKLPEVAQLLGVPRGYAYELARRGQLPTVRFGKYVRVYVSDLREWMAQHHEKGLDPSLYTVYSSVNSRQDGDGQRTSRNPKAARADASRLGGAARRHVHHRSPMGAGRGADPRTDGTTNPTPSKHRAKPEA